MPLVTEEKVLHKSEGFGPNLLGEITASGLVQYDPNLENEGVAKFTGYTAGADGDSTKLIVYILPNNWTETEDTILTTVVQIHVPSDGPPPVFGDE